MGSETSKKDNKEANNENYDIKINHQKFQHFKYLQAEDLIQIATEADGQKDIKAWDNDLKRVNSFKYKESLLLPVRHQFTPRGFCGNLGSVKIYYENFPYLFEQEIDNRMNMNKHFQQEQLWYLLYSLVTVAHDFSTIDRKIGDVRPSNIFINEEGQIKIANIFSWPYEKTNFQKTAFQKQLTYLSPEEMRLISKGQQQNATNKILSESFSIGLTLLQAGLLFKVKQLYSLQNYSLDLANLNHQLGLWQNLQFLLDNNIYQTYSLLLKQIVARMCSPNQANRLLSTTVYQILKPYQNEILNLRQFDHNIQLPLPNTEIESSPVRPFPTQLVEYPNSYRSVPPNTLHNLPQQVIQTNLAAQPKVNGSLPAKTIPTLLPVFPANVINQGNQQVRFQLKEQNPVQIQNITYTRPTFQPAVIQNNHAFKVQFTNSQVPPTKISNNVSTYYPSQITHANTNTFLSGANVTYPPSNHSGPIYPNQIQPAFISGNLSSANYQTHNFSSTHTVQKGFPGEINSSVNDSSSDFLKKIDEQLELSRRQFPS